MHRAISSVDRGSIYSLLALAGAALRVHRGRIQSARQVYLVHRGVVSSVRSRYAESLCFCRGL